MPECQNRRKKHQTPANPQNRATSVKVECSLSNSYRSNAKRGPIRIRCTCWGVKFLNHPTSAQTPGKRKDLKISGMWILQVMYHIYISYISCFGVLKYGGFTWIYSQSMAPSGRICKVATLKIEELDNLDSWKLWGFHMCHLFNSKVVPTFLLVHKPI